MESVQTGFLVVQFGHGRIHGDEDFFTGLVACLFDGLEYNFNGFLVALNVGGKTSLISYVGAIAFALQHRLEVVEDLGTHSERLAEARCSNRHDHEFLEVDGIVRMLPTVQDVHHGNGKRTRCYPTHILEYRQVGSLSCSASCCQTDRQNRIRTQVGFIGGAIRLKHGGIHLSLIRYF